MAHMESVVSGSSLEQHSENQDKYAAEKERNLGEFVFACVVDQDPMAVEAQYANKVQHCGHDNPWLDDTLLLHQ